MRVEGRGCGTVDRCVARVSSRSRALAPWRLLFLSLPLSPPVYLSVYPSALSSLFPPFSVWSGPWFAESTVTTPLRVCHSTMLELPRTFFVTLPVSPFPERSRAHRGYCSFPSGTVSPTRPNVGRRRFPLQPATDSSNRHRLYGWGSRWKCVILFSLSFFQVGLENRRIK